MKKMTKTEGAYKMMRIPRKNLKPMTTTKEEADRDKG